MAREACALRASHDLYIPAVAAPWKGAQVHGNLIAALAAVIWFNL